MKITKRQLRRIIKEVLRSGQSSEELSEWFISKKKEDTISKALAGMKGRKPKKNDDLEETEVLEEDDLENAEAEIAGTLDEDS